MTTRRQAKTSPRARRDEKCAWKFCANKLPVPFLTGRRAIYCSSQCRNAAWRDREATKERENYERLHWFAPGATIKCDACGLTLGPLPPTRPGSVRRMFHVGNCPLCHFDSGWRPT